MISASPYRDDVMDRQWSTGLGDRMLLVDCVIFHRKDLFFFLTIFTILGTFSLCIVTLET